MCLVRSQLVRGFLWVVRVARSCFAGRGSFFVRCPAARLLALLPLLLTPPAVARLWLVRGAVPWSVAALALSRRGVAAGRSFRSVLPRRSPFCPVLFVRFVPVLSCHPKAEKLRRRF